MQKLSALIKLIKKGPLILAGLFFFSFARGENGTLNQAKYASCGRHECVTINKNVAYTSFSMAIIDFPNSALVIQPFNGKKQTLTTEDISIDTKKIILRKVAELSGRDAVYDLDAEKLVLF